MTNPDSRSANYTAPGEASRALRFTIPVELAGLRLDQAPARPLPAEPRPRPAQLIDEGRGRRAGGAGDPPPQMKSGGAGGGGRPPPPRPARPPPPADPPA